MQVTETAEVLLNARHAAERILRVWGGSEVRKHVKLQLGSKCLTNGRIELTVRIQCGMWYLPVEHIITAVRYSRQLRTSRDLESEINWKMLY